MPLQESLEFEIARLGAAGDGVAAGADGRPVFIPYALPGERVSARLAGKQGEGQAAELTGLLRPAPERVTPPCPHFGRCGGCVLQHMAIPPYAEWKRARLAEALSRAGYADAPVAEPAVTPPHTRRRADLALRRADGVPVLGFHARGSGAVVDLSTCVVLDPRLVALFGPLKTLLRSLSAFRREGSAVLNLLETGPDLLLRLDGIPSPTDRALLAEFAGAHGLPRIACAPLKGGVAENVAQVAPVSITLGDVPVAPAPGAFLQATPQGEAAIVAAVLAGLPPKLTGKARIADLYAGLGTLSFPLSARARVTAYEGAPDAVAALDAAARKSGGRVTAVKRDLARQPLSVKELEAFAAVVLDPPYAGAADQIPALARSAVQRIIYVSCNPAALGRDAGLLNAGGWRLVSATPIDQFLWSAQLEAVMVFARGA
ncbi:class I SAM-dependent RNA methyltransferase [Roseomonas marmotae]|uniref:Class I SAM-dependent RNA methyltransferase n=1 Tax=Roseomonas marmotae TaxID=2768161 RepID=A0ABS3KF45_9PROT|nr:RsmD family RNA methyltransferase [Roseomonas marmotae]MBO1075617.1 class I SAM-dependent RNA methyltransferase [Roseomonas marmotae]QTI79479.1 class I SAM-dependent RNA methyltransferase [Roseomonas marmotae]